MVSSVDCCMRGLKKVRKKSSYRKKVDDVALPLPSFPRAKRKKKKDYKSDIRFNKPRVICIK